MNEYSRELMHMTTSEKADYNRRYYQRNKQYWKDYYKTGRGIGRKPGALSGNQAIKWDWENEKSSSVSPVRKWKTYTEDGRPQYNYSRDNASQWRETRNSGKSLDYVNDDRVRDAMKNWEDRRAESWWDDDRIKTARTNGAYGDYATIMEERNRRRDTMRTIRPRTANIPTKTVDRAKAAMKEFFMVGIPETAKELSKRGVRSAKKFLENLGIL